jgi:hypothetical protein
MPLYYPKQEYQIGGNIASSTNYIYSGNMTLAGGNNVTLSQGENAITISGSNIGTGSFWPDLPPYLLPIFNGNVGNANAATSAGTGTNSTLTNYTMYYYICPQFIPINLTYQSILFAANDLNQNTLTSKYLIYSGGIYSNNNGTLSLIQDYYGGYNYNNTTGGTYTTSNTAGTSTNTYNNYSLSMWSASTAGASTNSVYGFGFAGVSTATFYTTTFNNTGTNLAQIISAGLFRLDNNSKIVNLTGGNYWFLFGHHELGGIYFNMMYRANTTNAQLNFSYTELGLNTNAIINSYPLIGSLSSTYSSASNTASMFLLPKSIATSLISSNSFTPVFVFYNNSTASSTTGA